MARGRLQLVGELASYLRKRKAYWLLPVALTLLLLGLLIVAAQSTAVSPFIYTLF